MAQKKQNTRLKVIILSIIFISLCTPIHLFSQKIKKSDVPEVVQQTLLREHPMAKIREWSIEEKLFVAIITEDGMRGRVFIKADGEWELTKFETSPRELPVKITKYVKDNYPNFIISECSLAITSTDRTHYYLEVKRTGIGAGLPSKLKFSTVGDLIKRDDPEGFTIQETATEKEVEKRERVAKNPDAGKKEKKSKEEEKAPDFIINESLVPVPVAKTFSKRFRGAINPVWKYKEGDTTYTVECLHRELKTSGLIHEDGTWIETRSEMPEKSMFGAVNKFLNEHYRGYKYVYAEKIVRADKNNGYETRIIQKKHSKSKLETLLIFDKSGRIFKTHLPEDVVKPEEQIRTATDIKFAEKFEKEKESLIDGARKTRNTEISIRELPSPILSYIKDNYSDFRTKNAYFIEDEDLGNAYQIKVQKDGINQPFVELFFDKFGVFLRSEDDQGKEILAHSETSEVPQIDEVNVPEIVKKAFVAKYPKITAVNWEETNDGYEATYDDRKGKQKALFSPDGTWISTSSQVNPDNVPSSIKEYIKKNHGKRTEITKAWLVKKNDKKTYYRVEILDKRTSIDDELEFTQSGKLVE
ncbi:MAG: PepSY-like domain-containing protein [Bacteroidales bacterium]|nr:PepSY-like domain-containing protein [Bacteroidales bacterium]